MAVTKTTTISALGGNLIIDFDADTSYENNVTAATSGENGDDVYLIKNVSIPYGSSLEIVEGKIVMQAGDVIKVESDTAASIDVALSVLEQT